MPQYARLQIKTATETESWDNVGFGDNDYKVPSIIYANTVKDGSGTDYVPLLDSDGHLQVDILSMTGGGDASAANQTTMITHLSEIEGAVETLEAADLMLGTDFSNVFGSASLISATPAVKVEEQGTVTVDLGVNNDVTLATLPDTAAGDLAAINTAVSGTLTVGSHAVTNAGTFAVQEDGDALTALQLIDDTVVVLGTATYTEASSKGNVIGAVRNDTLATLADTDNEFAPLQVNASGALYIQEGSALDVSAATVTVSGTVTANLSSTDNTVLDNIDSNTDYGAVTGGGTETGALRVTLANNSTGVISIDDGGNVITVDGTVTANLSATDNQVLDDISADTGNIDTKLGTIDTDTGNIATSVAVMDDWDNAASDGASVSGDVAHNGVDAGEPVKIGYKSIALKATPTAVAANDRTNGFATRGGIPFVIGGAPNILSQSLQITDTDGAQTDTAIIAVAAGTAIVVTKVSVMADNANTVDVSCRIGFGTANTPAADAAQVILFHPGIAAGSGVVEGSGAGIIGIGASNEDLRVTCEDPVTGSINIVVTYWLESI